MAKVNRIFRESTTPMVKLMPDSKNKGVSMHVLQAQWFYSGLGLLRFHKFD
jgi:hypothetical protein